MISLRPWFFCFLLLFACNTAKQVVTTTPDTATPPEQPEEMEIRNLDTLVVTAPSVPDDPIPNDLPTYRATARRTVDLLHTKLDLRFDWANEKVIGKATLRLSPFSQAIEQVVLDARNFEIKSMRLLSSGVTPEYEYDGQSLVIKLDKPYEPGQEVSLYIDYVASPSEGDGSGAAITSDKGLFFINADGSDRTKPQQIWTQGETEFNSNWFPTVDKPNERQTHEIVLTVDQKFKTLSNGIMSSTRSNPDGTRTDTWKMDQPHAPYLVMLGVGDFAKVSDRWQNIPVEYYVEPEYQDDAKEIFNHTPEMITFFSELTGVPYPWKKYSQIVVRDYVSGAMENTTAVIFGQQVQKHKRELIDNNNDYIVAHELIHHWFGNYVTCESWAHLTLNEGFANYGEYLWFEHKYGSDVAEHHRANELGGYLYEAQTKRHPLIDYQYGSKEDMFDAHSYNKGGLVLHMLRSYLGDELFFAGWKTYLLDNAMTAVEIHNLRLAYEKVTGEDLNWFFNQWYLSSGHPDLEYSHSWDAETRTLQITVDQTQDPDQNQPIYILPTELDIYYADGTHEIIQVEINQRTQVENFSLAEQPVAVILDPKNALLATKAHDLDLVASAVIYGPSVPYMIRDQIVERVANLPDSGAHELLEKALDDPFWEVRRKALNSVDWEATSAPMDKLTKMAEYDEHSQVKADALMILAVLRPDTAKDVLISKLGPEEPYPVVASAVMGLYRTDPELCLEKIESLQDEKQADIVAAISAIYQEMGDVENLAYFEKHMTTVEGFQALSFYGNMEGLMQKLSGAELLGWLEKSAATAQNPSANPYARIGATRSIIGFLKRADDIPDVSEDQIKTLLDAVLANEKNQQIQSIYQTLLGS